MVRCNVKKNSKEEKMEQIIFEKLTVEEEKDVIGGVRPEYPCNHANAYANFSDCCDSPL
jgi:hypothetical protein